MTDEQIQKITGKKVPKLYYRLDDFQYSDTPKTRVVSGIDELDYCTKGFEMGCITIWTGLTNSGKTTLMTMLSKRIVQQGEFVFFFNGEQTKEDFKNNLYIQSSDNKQLQQKQYKNTRIQDTFVNVEQAFKLDKMLGNKIFIYNNEAPRDINTLLYAMEEARRKQKIRVFFLDNFMQIDIKKDNVFQEQTDIMEKLRTFAVNKKVHIMLVAHPRKTEKFQVRLNLFDVAGSSNLTNKAYNIISIMRRDNMDSESNEYKKLALDMLKDNYDIEQCDAILEVLKTKGTKCGFVGLKYNKQLKTFDLVEKINAENVQMLMAEFNNAKKKGDNPYGR